MQIAKQLISLIIAANYMNISHNRLNMDCIKVVDLNFLEDSIKIKVTGFETIHL